ADIELQEMYHRISTEKPEIPYRKGIDSTDPCFTEPLPEKRVEAMKKVLKQLKEYNEIFNEIYERAVRCCPVPETIISELPKHAKYIMDYELLFKRWKASGMK